MIKQDSSNKQDLSKKQGSSSKQTNSFNLKNVDPDFLLTEFSELYNSEYDCNEKAGDTREHAMGILAEKLRVKKIPRKEYNTL